MSHTENLAIGDRKTFSRVSNGKVYPMDGEICTDENYKNRLSSSLEDTGILPPPYTNIYPHYQNTNQNIVWEQQEITNRNIEAFRKRRYGCLAITFGICLAVVLLLLGLYIVVLIIGNDNNTSTTVRPISTTPLEPGWIEWTHWSGCGVTCGGGQSSRSRECQPQGYNCKGVDKQSQICSTQRCPIPEYGTWSNWNPWSACDVSCRGGTQSRSRVCSQGPGEEICPGNSTQNRGCNEWECSDCDRVCPGGGRSNSQCNRCVCSSSSTFAATITDVNNLPLENVTVADVVFPGVILDVTDKQGKFNIASACYGIQLLFERINFVSKTVRLVKSISKITLDKIEYLTITSSPQNNERISGEAVTFCCEIAGNPPPDYVEWFHDGVIVDSLNFFGNKSTYALQNVCQQHSGYYRCRANNDYSSVYSENAMLVVKDSSKDFCSDSPGPSLIDLPPGCLYHGNSQIDVGYCTPISCRGNNSTDETTCQEKNNNCCGPVEYTIIEVNCEGFTLPVNTIKNCGCTICSRPSVTIVGRAYSSGHNEPLQFGQILINGTVIDQTNINGDFMFKLPYRVRRIAITARDINDKLVETTKVLYFGSYSKGTFYTYIPMQPNGKIVDIKSGDPTLIALGDQEKPFAFVIVPPNSFYDMDGKIYGGSVYASVNIIDPGNMTHVQKAPGDLSFVDDRGERQILQTFGMFSIIFKKTINHEKVQLNEKAQVILNKALVGKSLSEPKTWALNQKSGSWENAEPLKSDDGSYIKFDWKKDVTAETGFDLFSDYIIGNITIAVDYTWNNFDGQSDRACYSKIRAFSNNKFKENDWLENVQMTVIIEENGIYSSSKIRAWTDEDDSNGYCIVHLCAREQADGDSYTAWLIAEDDNLETPKRLHPAEGDDTGIDNKVLEDINHEVIDGEYGAIKYNPSLYVVGNNGPLYDWDGYDKGIKDWAYSDICSKAKFDENHFRFFDEDVTDPCLYQMHLLETVKIDVDGTPISPPHVNYLAWYATSHKNEHKSCFIKVLVENGGGLRFRTFSSVGNTTVEEINPGTLYGLHDRCPQSDGSSSICMELKKSGEVTDGYTKSIDETIITVTQYPDLNVQKKCQRTGINNNFILYEHKILDPEDTSMFKMYLTTGDYGMMFGIYCHRSSESINDAQDQAFAQCANGNNVPFVRKPYDVNNENPAVTFSCQK